jgi:hypothetical protein
VCTCSRRYKLPKATISGAKGPGKGGKAHQGLLVVGAVAEDWNIQVVRNLDTKFGCLICMHAMVYISCKDS